MFKISALFLTLLIPTLALAEVEPLSTPSPNVGTITPTAIVAETGSFSGSVTASSVTAGGSGMLVNQTSGGSAPYESKNSARSFTMGMNLDGADGNQWQLRDNTDSKTLVTVAGDTDLLSIHGSTLTVASSGIVSAPSQPATKASIATAHSLGSGATVDIFFGNESAPNFDRQNMHDATNSSNTFTARGAGIYLLNCTLRFNNEASAGQREVFIKNGAASTTYAYSTSVYPILLPSVTATSIASLSDGDTVICQASQASGSTVTLVTNEGNSYFSMVKLW